MQFLIELAKKYLIDFVLKSVSNLNGKSKQLKMIEKAILANAKGDAVNQAKEYAKYFLVASKELGLNLTAEVLVHLASQIGHESRDFQFQVEQAKNGTNEDEYFESMYGMRKGLGNTTPGDGSKYRGRGFIQLTGKYNYECYGQKIGVDLVNQPELASNPKIAAKVALAYFKDRVLKKLGKYGFEDEVVAVSKAINCPNARSNDQINGLADRLARAKRTKEALDC